MALCLLVQRDIRAYATRSNKFAYAGDHIFVLIFVYISLVSKVSVRPSLRA
jgi:hypothetical protein